MTGIFLAMLVPGNEDGRGDTKSETGGEHGNRSLDTAGVAQISAHFSAIAPSFTYGDTAGPAHRTSVCRQRTWRQD